MPLREGTSLYLSFKRLRPVPFPLQNQDPLKKRSFGEPKAIAFGALGRVLVRFSTSGPKKVGLSQLPMSREDNLLASVVTSLSNFGFFFTPWGTLGSCSDCDWRPFGYPKALIFQLTLFWHQKGVFSLDPGPFAPRLLNFDTSVSGEVSSSQIFGEEDFSYGKDFPVILLMPSFP